MTLLLIHPFSLDAPVVVRLLVVEVVRERSMNQPFIHRQNLFIYSDLLVDVAVAAVAVIQVDQVLRNTSTSMLYLLSFFLL